MMSAKIAAPSLPKITVFRNKGYDIILSIDGVTNKILSRDLVAVAFLWENLSQPQFYKDLTGKTAFLEGWSWFNNLRLTLWTNLKLYTSMAKRLKLKVRKFRGANSYVCRSYRVKSGRRGVLSAPPPPPPSWIGLRSTFPNAYLKLEGCVSFEYNLCKSN